MENLTGLRMTEIAEKSPGALLLIAPQCPHCPSVLESLTRLIKEGKIGRLEVVNLAEHPEMAEELAGSGLSS